MNDSIIVSAFISDINVREGRNIDDYLRFGKELLTIPVRKVVFLDRVSASYFTPLSLNESSIPSLFDNPLYPETIFVLYELSDSYLYDLKEKIYNPETNSKTAEKDTIEYRMVQCNKTEWMRKAIELNLFSTDSKEQNYIWIDFGIFHMIKDAEILRQGVIQMVKQQYSTNVRIASCKAREYTFLRDVFKDIIWLFAGSVFGGSAKNIIDFADKMKHECTQLIYEHGRILWEINVWYILHKKCPEIFDFYDCRHERGILEKY